MELKRHYRHKICVNTVYVAHHIEHTDPNGEPIQLPYYGYYKVGDLAWVEGRWSEMDAKLMIPVNESANDPYLEYDEGIRDAVRYFNEHGFATSSSCEGGEGHAFDLPTIIFVEDPDTTLGQLAGRISRLTHKKIRNNFIVSAVSTFVGSGTKNHVKLELLARDDAQYLTDE